MLAERPCVEDAGHGPCDSNRHDEEDDGEANTAYRPEQQRGERGRRAAISEIAAEGEGRAAGYKGSEAFHDLLPR